MDDIEILVDDIWSAVRKSQIARGLNDREIERIRRADRRLAAATRDGNEDSWHEEEV